jgi:predicted transcriptional regulator
VWRFTGSFQQATQVATFTGQLAAFGFMSWGVFIMISGQFFDGLWLVFIGWFLQNAAAASYAQATLQQSLHGVTVSQAMTHDCPLVSGHLPLQDLVEEHILSGGRRCFMVSENHRLRGMLTLHDVARVPRTQWDHVTTEQIMVPWERMIRVSPSTALLEALQIMDNANVNQVPVVEGNDIVGMLSREHLLHYLRTRAELGM